MRQDNNWNDGDERLVLYLDIMGFKERVAQTAISTLKEQLLAFKRKNNRLKPLLNNTRGGVRRDFLKMAQFSDSIVVISQKSTIEDLNRLTKASVILMQTAMESGFALRGSIASGKMIFDEANQLFFGKALVDAYLLEEDLAFYGVVFHHTAEKLVRESLESNNDIYLPIEDVELSTKKGKSKHFHIAWFKINKDLSEGSIVDDALGWLKVLSVSLGHILEIFSGDGHLGPDRSGRGREGRYDRRMRDGLVNVLPVTGGCHECCGSEQ